MNGAEVGAAAEDDEMSRINPFLWFDDQAEEAANVYVPLFQLRAAKAA